jgi:hypothetical protein
MSTGRRGRDEFRFDARYGRLMRKAGIGTVPFAILFYQAELGLTPPEVWLIVFVLAHRWTSDIPYPAVREIERRSGVSKKTLFKYKASLTDKGYLEVVHRTRADGGNSSIGWDFSPLFEKVDDLIMRDLEWWKNRNPQFIDEDSLDGNESPRPGENRVDNLRGGGLLYTGPGVQDYTRGGNRPYTRDGNRAYTGPGDTGTPHGEEDNFEEETGDKDIAEPVKNQQSKLRTAPSLSKLSVSKVPPSDSLQEDESRPSLSALIDRIVTDYSARLHDQEKNTRSNCTRARRLWVSSELPEDDFVTHLHEAYRRTQESSHRIRKSAQDAPYGTKNKMPYFFSVLARLVESATGES